MYHFLDFEKSISVLEGKIEELRNISSKDGLNIGLEVSKLEEQLESKLKKTYSQLTPWDKVKVARHPLRPHPSEIIKNVFTNWQPLAGDRGFKEDNALLGGVAKLGDVPCVVIGIEKGKTVDKRIFHNFGMVRPEGYRKAQRLINFADKFSLPVITLIDTAGAYPGKGAEERGQAEAIASCIKTSLNAKIPIISLVTGEGGSGGALGIGVGDHYSILEHATYSVASPEACSSIIWRTAEKAASAAEAMKVSAQELIKIGIVDEIISEPNGGAHRNYSKTARAIKSSILENIAKFKAIDMDKLLEMRYQKLLKIG